ncbi:HET-domain-containing protein, partial [Melanomma pulvis-pyrius CBS 109.77]
MQPLIKSTGLSEYKISHNLSLSTQSDSAVNFLLEKYHDCREKHAQCSLPERPTSTAYPSRLLNVGTEEHSLIILCSTNMFRDEEYVCLSHCWGEMKPFTLNAETQSALVRGVNVTTLPKTFQDAINVTRRLCIQYLWIDSLCILQDNEDDWATESGRMGHIYAHAACTIAATASKDSSGGLFFARCPQLLEPRRVYFDFSPKAPWLEGKDVGFTLVGTYLCDVQHLAERCIEDAPLNSRAWVSQERQLSRRLLHFTSTQLFWECYECTACETYPECLPDWARPFWLVDATLLKDRLRNITKQDKDGLDINTYYAWVTYRYQYSRCALTHNTDKLVAIHGIANRVSQATGDEFVAGLWRSRIIEELCWNTGHPTTKTTEWRAPTWSWASSNAAINFSLLTKFHGGHSSRHIEAELVELDVRTKASGQLEDASMKIKCKLLSA